MALNKQDIFNIDDIEYKIVKVKAWGNAELKIKTLTAKEKVEFVKLLEKDNTEMGMIIYLIIHSCVDDNNNRLFDLQDKPTLENKSAGALIELAEHCLKFSNVGQDMVEDEAKN